MTGKRGVQSTKRKIELLPVEELEIGLFLRLHAFCLTEITDSAFMRGVVRRLRRELKNNKNPKSIIRHPVGIGAAYYVAVLSIDRFFHFLIDPEDHRRGLYDLVEVMSDILEGWCLVNWDSKLDRRLGRRLGLFMGEYDNERDFERRVDLLVDRGPTMLSMLGRGCLRDPLYPTVRHAYGMAIADRLLHDRQISGFIASELVALAPRKSNQERFQFVRRSRWPAFVKPLIQARDRGKCAICKMDIASELLARAHIDHMYPLSEGGCNDVVNLQLSCETCNLTKGQSWPDVQSSIPRYHRRHTKRQLVDSGKRSPFSTVKV